MARVESISQDRVMEGCIEQTDGARDETRRKQATEAQEQTKGTERQANKPRNKAHGKSTRGTKVCWHLSEGVKRANPPLSAKLITKMKAVPQRPLLGLGRCNEHCSEQHIE